MKILFISICFALCMAANAQSPVTKSYPAQPGQRVTLRFDYPVVKISTWDKNEVSVTADVNINEHENDNAFVLKEETVNGAIEIGDEIKDIDKLPRRYTILRNGVKTVYKSRSAFEEAEKSGDVQQSYDGLDMHIELEIKIPASCVTEVNAIYGIVELTNFNASVKVDAEYGGIDATINTASTGKLQATTHYGQIYSNLDMKITDHEERDFYNSITAEPGKGPEYTFLSTYGKIYLRKP